MLLGRGDLILVSKWAVAVERNVFVFVHKEELLHAIFGLFGGVVFITVVKLFLVKVDFLQGFINRNFSEGVAVFVFLVTILEKSSVGSDHQVAFCHDIVVFNENDVVWFLGCAEGRQEIAQRIFLWHFFFLEIVEQEGVELEIRNAFFSIKRQLTKNLPLVNFQFGHTVHKNFVEVVFVHYGVDFDIEARIKSAEFLQLFLQLLKGNSLTIAFPAYSHIGFVIEGINGNSYLGNQVDEGTDVFKMASVGNNGNFEVHFVSHFDDLPKTFLLQNGLATYDIETLLGEEAIFEANAFKIFKYLSDIVWVCPDFLDSIPFRKTVFALVVTRFGDVPVDDDGLDVH